MRHRQSGMSPSKGSLGSGPTRRHSPSLAPSLPPPPSLPSHLPPPRPQTPENAQGLMCGHVGADAVPSVGNNLFISMCLFLSALWSL